MYAFKVRSPLPARAELVSCREKIVVWDGEEDAGILPVLFEPIELPANLPANLTIHSSVLPKTITAYSLSHKQNFDLMLGHKPLMTSTLD